MLIILYVLNVGKVVWGMPVMLPRGMPSCGEEAWGMSVKLPRGMPSCGKEA